jgi:hypothetical protein
MPSRNDKPIHSPIETVYIIGAGFSADLGYPLTSHLLPRVKRRLSKDLKSRFEKIVRFHHPGWDGRGATLPDIEELLTELSANEELLPALRSDGPFKVHDIQTVREELLYELALWFHEIHLAHPPDRHEILERFMKKLKSSKNPVVISFNWDYELDREMFGPGKTPSTINPGDYGLNQGQIAVPALLKPHGSLNWYPSPPARHIREDLRVRLWKRTAHEPSIYCFLRWREPHSKEGRHYVPWIVPPTHWKRFDSPMMQHIWKRCVDSLSTARKIYFLGYSLPVADWHSRYIIRCGFHNQIDGLPIAKGDRATPTERAKVTVVNPDKSAFQRIESACGVKCRWIDKTLKEWLNEKK